MAINSGVTPRPDIALAVQQEMTGAGAYVATKIFPIFPVSVSTAPIPRIMPRRRVERLFRPKGGRYPRSALTVETAGTFNCEFAGFEETLDAKDIELYGGEDIAMAVTAQKAAQTVLINRDAALAASIFNTTTFDGGYNTAGAAAWNNAIGKPIDDVLAAAGKVRQRIGIRANTLLISGTAYEHLCVNVQIQSQVRGILGYTDKQGGIAALINLEVLAAAFSLKQVIVADGIKNTADEGLTAVLADIWDSTKALVCYVPEADDRMSPGLGRTFLWDADMSDVVTSGVASQSTLQGLHVEYYDDPSTEERVVRAKQCIDMLLLNKDAGHLVTGI